MKCNKTYTNHYVKIEIFSNSREIIKLADNFLDFNGSHSANPKMTLRFYINETGLEQRPRGKRNLFYRTRSGRDDNASLSIRYKGIDVVAVPGNKTVRATIFNYKDILKDTIISLVFCEPLYFILSRYGFFHMHVSSVRKDKRCILIGGEQGCGKSTLALTLGQNGFDILTDDKCFIKIVKNRPALYPFQTKMGLNENIFKKYPILNKHALKNFHYGGKRRISLKAISNSDDIKKPKCTMIMFPNYKVDKEIDIKEITAEEALYKLCQWNTRIHQKEQFEKIFWLLYEFTRRIPAFEITYNDERLDEIPGFIEKAFA